MKCITPITTEVLANEVVALLNEYPAPHSFGYGITFYSRAKKQHDLDSADDLRKFLGMVPEDLEGSTGPFLSGIIIATFTGHVFLFDVQSMGLVPDTLMAFLFDDKTL